MTVIASIPIRQNQAGDYTTPNVAVPVGSTRLAISIEQDAWRVTTDTLARGRIEISRDGGATYVPLLNMALNGIPDEDENGQPTTEPVSSGAQIYPPADASTMIRAVLTLTERLRAGVTVEAT